MVDVPAATFRSQLAWLVRHATVLSLDDAIEQLQSGTVVPRAVVVTFDDAFDNFRTHAWPVLQQFDVAATLYAPIGFLDGVHPSPLTGAHLPSISYRDLRQLAQDPRLTVGSHSYSHVDLRTLTNHALRSDLVRARRRLEDELGRSVTHFCYPQAKWSTDVESVVSILHTTAAIAGGFKNTARRFRPLRIKRVPVRSDMMRLDAVLTSAVWLEEWIANTARAYRPQKHA